MERRPHGTDGLRDLSGEKVFKIKEVGALQALEALITKEADSMSAMKFRMRKADMALWMDMKFYKNK